MTQGRRKFKVLLVAIAFLSVGLASSSKFILLQFRPDSDLATPPFDSSTLQELADATAHVLNVKGKPLGRAYVTPKQDLLITAAHVLAAECDSLSCTDLSLKIRNPGTRKTFIFLINRLYCSRWLDICAAGAGSDVGSAFSEIRWDQDSASRLFIYPLQEGLHKQWKAAELKRSSAFGGLWEVIARPGYSGSPAFTPQGELGGIFSSGTETNLFFAPAFVVANALGARDKYFPESYIVPTKDMKVVLQCKISDADCFDSEASILIRRFLLLARNTYDWTFFIADNAVFWSEWKERAPPLEADEPFSEIGLLAALNTYHQAPDQKRREGVRDLILKRLGEESKGPFEFVRTWLLE